MNRICGNIEGRYILGLCLILGVDSFRVSGNILEVGSYWTIGNIGGGIYRGNGNIVWGGGGG